MMLGPFLLKYHHMFVSSTLAGAFILSKNGRAADYVGATPTDLVGTLGRFGRQTEYRYFWFVEADSADEAAEIEQVWLHRYRPTDNSSRSAAPRGSGWRCTTEGCATCALTGDRR
ncbi:MAG: hypothetical protein ACREI9_11560 [Nitrospiraceae bacterium]